MTSYETKLAELSLVQSLPKMMVSEVKGRVKGKLQTISKKIEKYWRKQRQATDAEIDNTLKSIERFQEATGWQRGKGKDIATLILFGQAVLEDAEFEVPAGIIESLTDLILHFENHPDHRQRPKPACYWAADLAATKWQKVKEDTSNAMFM